MVKKIIHIADLHVPNASSGKPYNEMLKQLAAEILAEVKDDNKDEVRIVIAGDVFDKKIRSDNESKQSLHTFLNYLDAIAKTIIIAGNHDMLENNTERTDTITPTFSIKGVYPNITYADKELDYESGCIVDDNIIWAVFSMFSKFARPKIDAYKKKYPEATVIGLYHGDLSGSVTDSGRKSDAGIDLKSFKGCDIVMAGHIHRYQEIPNKKIKIVYAGSPFQTNIGENTSGHGFVIWNLDTMEHSLHEVKNDYKMYKFEITSYDDIKEDKERQTNV